ncbi:heme exporter protein CcmD [Thiohalorhabdus denitrificans]|uniref:Heme exporter protein D n=1 Tax=Thiohalorhabdus denitrificans TaxID=381306 RepID=A0A1G5BPD7_9GAMM|nr:heme exporter protein CcmD [Thiohalorhabdus denitrificans]SCX91937.1 heme exporter protein D [Thiohalorhabdus denitrificans]
MTLQEFFYMGGYGVFVWPSYGLALVILLVNLVVPHWRERRTLRQIARRNRR